MQFHDDLKTILEEGFEIIDIPAAAEEVRKVKDEKTLGIWQRLLINYANQPHNGSLHEFLQFNNIIY